jgi:hypothetical protein
MSQEEIGAALVARLSAICASHPEVERAFVFGHADPSGRTIYTFIPIFDRKVSDEVLNEADRAYRELIPDGPGLDLMLLARNSWKRTLAKDAPIYVRPKSD